MGSITVVSGRTLWKRVGIVALVGLGGMFLYGGVQAVDALKDRIQYNSIKHPVVEAIEAKDYERAAQALGGISASKELRAEDVASLTLDIERGKRKQAAMQRLEQEAQSDDAATAERALKQMEGKRTAEEIAVLRKKRQRSTEPGLRELMQSSMVYAERAAFAEEYLRSFPQGAYRTKAVENLLIGSVAQVSDLFMNKGEFGTTYAQIVQTANLLEAHQAEKGISLSDIIKPDAVKGQAETYIKYAQYMQIKDPLSVGSLVQVVAFRGMDDVYSNDLYLTERNKAVALDSVGKVIDVGTDIEVQFEAKYGGSFTWAHSWNSVVNHWDSKKLNVAGYRPVELAHITLITVIQRNLFDREVQRLIGAMGEYK